MSNQGHEGRDYQPYLITTLSDSGQDSSTGACGATFIIQYVYINRSSTDGRSTGSMSNELSIGHENDKTSFE